MANHVIPKSYSEGINLLYISNKFGFMFTFTLPKLPSYILSQRLSQLASVSLCWNMSLNQSQPVAAALGLNTIGSGKISINAGSKRALSRD